MFPFRPFPTAVNPMCCWQPLCAVVEGTGGYGAGWLAGQAGEGGDLMAEAHGWRRQESRRVVFKLSSPYFVINRSFLNRRHRAL